MKADRTRAVPFLPVEAGAASQDDLESPAKKVVANCCCRQPSCAHPPLNVAAFSSRSYCGTTPLRSGCASQISMLLQNPASKSLQSLLRPFAR
eukprot:gene12751-biopygen16957